MTDTLHASAFAHNGCGCLILGASGTGKSRLVADATALGAKMIADDRGMLVPMMGMVAAPPVPELLGILELRHLGLVRLNDVASKHVLHLVVELDAECDTRLPEPEIRQYLGVSVPYLRLPPIPKTSAAALLIYLKAMQESRVLPTDWKPKTV